ncbi:MAG: hypothetical protein HZB87_10970, partial [Desulfatitalea sp.]|nr:hypothetical protein [Desulfatitalea sp.]
MPFDAISEETQIAQSQHHAGRGGQMQKVVKADGRGDGEQKENDDRIGPVLHVHVVFDFFGRGLVDGQAHTHRRHQPVDHCGDEQGEEFEKRDLALLPHHQGGDVAERRKGAAGIGGHHNVDTGQGHEFDVAAGHGHHHRAHEQGRGQV